MYYILYIVYYTCVSAYIIMNVKIFCWMFAIVQFLILYSLYTTYFYMYIYKKKCVRVQIKFNQIHNINIKLFLLPHILIHTIYFTFIYSYIHIHIYNIKYYLVFVCSYITIFISKYFILFYFIVYYIYIYTGICVYWTKTFNYGNFLACGWYIWWGGYAFLIIYCVYVSLYVHLLNHVYIKHKQYSIYIYIVWKTLKYYKGIICMYIRWFTTPKGVQYIWEKKNIFSQIRNKLLKQLVQLQFGIGNATYECVAYI